MKKFGIVGLAGVYDSNEAALAAWKEVSQAKILRLETECDELRRQITATPPSIDADMAMRLQVAKAALDAMDAPVTEAEGAAFHAAYMKHGGGIDVATIAALNEFLTTRIAARAP